MNNLRQYINLIDNQQLLNEKFGIRAATRAASSNPKVGDIKTGSDGFQYEWKGAQWVRKPGQAGGSKIATKAVAAQLTTDALRSRGNVLMKLIKKYPKSTTFAALSAIVGAGAYTASELLDKDEQEEPTSDTDQVTAPETPQDNQADQSSRPGTTSAQPTQPTQPTVNPEIQKIADEAKLVLKDVSKFPTAQVKNAAEELDMALADIPGLNWKPASWL